MAGTIIAESTIPVARSRGPKCSKCGVFSAFFIIGLALVPIIGYLVVRDENLTTPREHTLDGAPFVGKTTGLFSENKPWRPRTYRSLPFPGTQAKYSQNNGFFSAVFSVFSMHETAIDQIEWKSEAVCHEQRNGSGIYYSTYDIDAFREAIQNDMRINFYIDTVPVVGPAEERMWYGIPIGHLSGGNVVLYNYYEFTIYVTDRGEAYLATVQPMATNADDPCGEISGAPLTPVLSITWAYRVTVVQTSSVRYKDSRQKYEKILQTTPTQIQTASIVWISVGFASVLLFAGIFLFSIYHRRFELNGCMQSLKTVYGEYEDISLTGLSMRDVEDEADHGLLELEAPDGGIAPDRELRHRNAKAAIVWKKWATYIFKAPAFSTLFAALVGSGIHVLVITVFGLCMYLALPFQWLGMWQKLVALLIMSTGGIAGFVAFYIKAQMAFDRPLTLALTVLFILPIPVAVAFFSIASIEIVDHSAKTIWALFVFCFSMVVADFVSILCGMYVASNLFSRTGWRPEGIEAFERGRQSIPPVVGKMACCSMGQVAGQEIVPSCCARIKAFFLASLLSTIVIGTGGFYITYLVIESAWIPRTVGNAWAVLLIILMWVFSVGLISIINVYAFITVWHLYAWWWPSFFFSAASAIPFSLIGGVYFIATVDAVDPDARFYAVVIVFVVWSVASIILGAVGVLFPWAFIRYVIYSVVPLK